MTDEIIQKDFELGEIEIGNLRFIVFKPVSDAYDALKAENAKLREAMRWHDIDQEYNCPDYNEQLLLATPMECDPGLYEFMVGFWIYEWEGKSYAGFFDANRNEIYPTKFMRIPEVG